VSNHHSVTQYLGNTGSRLEVRAQVRQLGRNAGPLDAVDKARETLSGLLLQLKTAQQAAGVSDLNLPQTDDNMSLHIWDDIMNESVPLSGHSGAGAGAGPRPPSGRPTIPEHSAHIEDHSVPLPSNGNITQTHCQLELAHRILRAEFHLTRIRELIADKSFQYSHVIRVSPRKGVTTRARTSVKKLNAEIAGHCRMYTQCQATFIRLGADADIHGRLRPLSPDDVKASTAIINPNEPGSTRLKLSWIWQTAAGQRLGFATGLDAGVGDGADADAILECK
jgi:hypothetical protein